MPRCPHAALATGLLLLAMAALGFTAQPAVSAGFIDSAGRRVILPNGPMRIMPAERSAEVLVYVLAPDKLAGLELLSGQTAKLPAGTRPPVIRFGPDATPERVAQAARDYRADLIVDAGPVTPGRAAFADAVQQRSGIPYILVQDGFDRLHQTLVTIGQILGVRGRADELELFVEYDITRLRGRQLIQPTEDRPHVYYALGPDGLTTALPGSPAGAAIDEAGGINVAGQLGRGTLARISRDQLLSWNPDLIIVEDRRFYNALLRERAWRGLSAVRGKKVYLEPSEPFGWISNPPGINRLIGLYWLSSLFYVGQTRQELRGVTCEFYEKFYHQRLTNAQLNAILIPAGEPPSEPTVNPSGGLGGAPAVPGSRAPSDAGNMALPPAAELGVPGVTTGPPVPGSPDQPDALCTIPGIASPINELTGTPSLPPAPGGRIRQPSAGGAVDTLPLPGLQTSPGR